MPMRLDGDKCMGKEQQRPKTKIGPHTTLTGELDTDRPIYVYGVFEGDLASANTVFVDEEGLLSANVTAEHVVVRGAVVGSMHAKRVEIHATGRVWGNLYTPNFYVEPGGFVRGQIVTPPQNERALPHSPLKICAGSFIQPHPPPDDLDRLLSELETAVQRAIATGGVPASSQPIHIKEALARVVEAKNQTISYLQLELQASQSALAKQEALIATLSTDDKTSITSDDHEAAHIQQNHHLGNEVKRLRLRASQNQQKLARTHLELEETRLALKAARDEIARLHAELTTVHAQPEHLSEELTRSQARYEHLVAATTAASQKLHNQLAKIKAERDQTVADLDTSRQRARQLAAERDALRATAARLETELAAAQERIIHLTERQEELRQTRDNIDDLKNDLDAALQCIDQLAAERDALRATVVRLTTELDAAENRASRLTRQLTQARAIAPPPDTDQDIAQTGWDGGGIITAQLSAELKNAHRRIARLEDQLDAQASKAQSPQFDLQKQMWQERLNCTTYCLTCHAQRPISPGYEIVTVNGRRAVKGRCAICGAGLLHLLPATSGGNPEQPNFTQRTAAQEVSG